MPPRILIAGIGNIFMGDDAFGVEVVRRLAESTLPEHVRVVDFGIRGFDLAMALLDELDLVILVDAAPRGGSPGTLYVIEPDSVENQTASEGGVGFDPHSLDPIKVLQFVQTMGGCPRRVLVVGCEPENIGSSEDGDILPGLSEPVRRAVEEGVILVESLIKEATESNPSIRRAEDHALHLT